jgi:integrase
VYNNIQQYKATEKHLKEFAKIDRKSDYQFNEINSDFYTRFVDYLQKPLQAKDSKGKLLFNADGTPILTKQPFTQNSVGKHIKVLKVMLNEAKNSDADTSNFYVYTEDVDNVYLNEIELTQLKAHDFAAVPHLDRVRDWFLLLAWTGSRFSDLEKIDKANIRNGMITYRQQKTNTSVTIPMHPVVSEVLQKYNFDMPELISNQKFNDYIKEACKAAKIDNTESLTRTVGGKLTTETMPKYELVSSHTCRRSFCTNMYLRGLDTMMIRSISGHKTEKSFLKYIKVSQHQHAEMMAKKWSEIYK